MTPSFMKRTIPNRFRREVNMKLFWLFFSFVAVCSLLVVSTKADSGLLPATEQQLAHARKGTARYHDLAEAEADGYVNIHLYLPGEGFHWVKPSLIDGTFDPAHPEVLLYAPVPGEDR